MFTGIIAAIGKLYKKLNLKGDVRLTIHVGDWGIQDVKLGDSIAINGVCLTVVEIDDQTLSFDVSTETLACTSLGQLDEKAPVNLEKAMGAHERFGGHIVTGHIDDLGEIVRIEPDARSTRVVIQVPKALAKYIAAKGSVCVDGVSLTVNEVEGEQFGVCIIPHTWEHTIFYSYQVGQRVNIEVDLMARYVARLREYESS